MAISRTPGPGERRSVGERRRLRRARARRRRALLLALLVLVCLAVALTVTNVLAVDKHGANVQHFQIHSERVHSTLNEALVVPPGSDGARRPLLVFLHGKGGNEDSELNSAFFAALAKLGPRAPDVLFPDGGDDSYWHDRTSGNWAASRWEASARTTSRGCTRAASAPLADTPLRCGARAPKRRKAHSTAAKTSPATT
jgi:poly(3-hydroxybutyrate) depolymerase